MRRNALPAAVAFLLSAGCSGGSTAGPSGPAAAPAQTATPAPAASPGATALPALVAAGTYRGAISDSVLGAGTLRLSFSQSGTSVTGTWGTLFPDPISDNSGTVTGTIQGANLSLMLSPAQPYACSYGLTATLSGTAISGAYVTSICTAASSGSVKLNAESFVVQSLAPSYSGSRSDEIYGSGTMNLSLTQSGSSIGGTWSSKFPNPGFNRGGSVSGEFVSETQAQVYLIPATPANCTLTAAITLSGTQLSAVYAAQNCDHADIGTFATSPN